MQNREPPYLTWCSAARYNNIRTVLSRAWPPNRCWVYVYVEFHKEQHRKRKRKTIYNITCNVSFTDISEQNKIILNGKTWSWKHNSNFSYFFFFYIIAKQSSTILIHNRISTGNEKNVCVLVLKLTYSLIKIFISVNLINLTRRKERGEEKKGCVYKYQWS